jgi:probable HAF family extracellular repeat protein
MSKQATFPKGTSALVFLSLCSIPAEAHDVSEPILIEDPQNRSIGVSDINNRGVVVGALGTDQPVTRVAFSWSRRTGIIDLPLAIENGFAGASAINDCGEIVGDATFSPGFVAHAARWTRAGEVEDLGALTDSVFADSHATDINELGAVVGSSEFDVEVGAFVHAFIWTEADGMRDLGTLGGLKGGESGALAVNNRNEVVGVSDDPPHAFFWSERTGMIDLGALVGGIALPSASTIAV